MEDSDYAHFVGTTPQEIFQKLFSKNKVILTLKGINKALAGGPLADSPHFFQRMFLSTDEKGNYLNIQILVELIKLIVYFRVPNDAANFTC